MSDSLVLAALAQQHNPFRASIYRSAATGNTANGVASVFPYDTALFDLNSDITGLGSAPTYNVPVDGYYSVTGVYQVKSGGAIVQCGIYLYQNAALTRTGTVTYTSATSTSPLSLTISVDILPCIAGDTLEIYYFTGAALATNVGLTNAYAEFALTAPR